jgi:signal transduction histidine kinase/CheY-like chemotaxis protein
MLAASLRPICVGLALFYALLTGWYLVQYEGAAQIGPALPTGLFSLGLLAAAVWFERNQVPLDRVRPITAAVASAIVLHGLLLLLTIPDARQTTNLMIAQLGFGCLLLSVRWYAAISVLSLLGWSGIAGDRITDPDWRHFGLALVEATAAGGLVLFVRVRAYRNIQALRVRDQALVAEVQAARDAALGAARAKSEFLANMSHEIRTPMTAMLGMAELLHLTALDERQAEYVATIDRSGRILLQIVNDILDFSKIEAGRLTLEEVSFDVAAVLTEVHDLLEHEANAKYLELQLQIEVGLPLFRGDPTRIKQVLINLVGNAIKFTPQGSIRISAHSSGRDDGSQARLEIAVADTGIGIAEAQQQRVFEAFTQADASTTRRYGGTGLGLAISSRLAQLMGGSIEMRSSAGAGSTFTLVLQLPIVDRPTVGPATHSELPAQYQGRILLVEDNIDNQILSERILHELGCVVDIAADGRLALEQVARAHYDLILMDCHMPQLNGYEATCELRRLEAAHGGHTPIVALSASVLPEERQRCLDVGMDDYVAKPFRRADLQRVLRRWLQVAEPTSGAAAHPSRRSHTTA